MSVHHRHRHHLPDRVTVLRVALLCVVLAAIWLEVCR